MQLLKWFSLMKKEVVMCNSRSIDHYSLLKNRTFDFSLVREGGGGGGGGGGLRKSRFYESI